MISKQNIFKISSQQEADVLFSIIKNTNKDDIINTTYKFDENYNIIYFSGLLQSWIVADYRYLPNNQK